jgi:hypothetical protein
MFVALHCGMPLLPPAPEPVPFDEVADVLAQAALRVGGGPPAMITASGRHLAASLEAAGFCVVRQCPRSAQFTL